MKYPMHRAALLLLCALLLPALSSGQGVAGEVPDELKESIDDAVAKVKPTLVRIHVVSTQHYGGREVKYESSGSGAIITTEGHVVTNHHVAGHATRLFCTLADKEEVEATLVGRDPLTDIAVIQLEKDGSRQYPVAEWGDSAQVNVGDYVLAMGSPMSLSQSVTLGIVSNTELVMPEWFGRWGRIEQDGEDVGSLVRWIGHDAQIYGGNSGGPLVNMRGQIVGINEISIGLGGAIPGNLARSVAEQIIATGEVKRAWLGIMVQPQLKFAQADDGVLVASVMAQSPAADAGLKPGDLLLKVGERPVNVRFMEQLPEFNQLIAELPLGEPVELVFRRNGEEQTVTVTPSQREEVSPPEHEVKEWGITGRNLSFVLAKEMKRENTDGVLVTSVRPGGGAGDAKPEIVANDVILEVGGKPVKNVAELVAATEAIVAGAEEPVPTLVEYERKTERLMTIVDVGVKDIEDPGLEVKKAWLPAQTQVITRDIAEHLQKPDMKGFRVTQVYSGSTAEQAGLQVGDYIVAVDDEPLTASAPEDYEQLSEIIRQYKIGSEAVLNVVRDGQELDIAVTLERAPEATREMKKYRDEDFEFTARNVTFFDKAKEKWEEDQVGVLVEEVEPGSWAALGMLEAGDLILQVDGTPIASVEVLEAKMEEIGEAKPKSVVFKVLRDIYTRYLEFEPNWETPALAEAPQENAEEKEQTS